MKVMDEKGRLFGKLNLIDLLVILILIAVVFVAVWKLGLGKAADAVVSPKQTVTFDVTFADTPESVCDFAHSQSGEKLVNNGKTLEASVVEVTTAEKETGETDLTVTVEAECTYSDYVYKVGTQEVRVGYEYILKTGRFEMTGVITDMEVQNG